MVARVNKLTWNVPIVDRQGRPSDEFFRKWNQQAAVNGGIPDLNTSAEVSAVLDILGATPPSLLVRGSSQWGPLLPPSDATKFLNGANPPAFARVKDSDLSVSNTTSNNASTLAHGFAPILPNDATKFLNGTGVYSTPSGGSTGSPFLAILAGPPTSADTSSDATKGTIYSVTAAIKIYALWMAHVSINAATFQGAIFDMAGNVTGTTLGTLQGRTTVTTDSAPNGWTEWLRMPFSSPVALTAGQAVMLTATRTDATASTTNSLFIVSGTIFSPIPAPLTNTESRILASILPVAGNTMSASGSQFEPYLLGVEWSF